MQAHSPPHRTQHVNNQRHGISCMYTRRTATIHAIKRGLNETECSECCGPAALIWDGERANCHQPPVDTVARSNTAIPGIRPPFLYSCHTPIATEVGKTLDLKADDTCPNVCQGCYKSPFPSPPLHARARTHTVHDIQTCSCGTFARVGMCVFILSHSRLRRASPWHTCASLLPHAYRMHQCPPSSHGQPLR